MVAGAHSNGNCTDTSPVCLAQKPYSSASGTWWNMDEEVAVNIHNKRGPTVRPSMELGKPSATHRRA
jgi:hypothetical protein